jgi:hypothetical protein
LVPGKEDNLIFFGSEPEFKLKNQLAFSWSRILKNTSRNYFNLSDRNPGLPRISIA